LPRSTCPCSRIRPAAKIRLWLPTSASRPLRPRFLARGLEPPEPSARGVNGRFGPKLARESEPVRGPLRPARCHTTSALFPRLAAGPSPARPRLPAASRKRPRQPAFATERSRRTRSPPPGRTDPERPDPTRAGPDRPTVDGSSSVGPSLAARYAKILNRLNVQPRRLPWPEIFHGSGLADASPLAVARMAAYNPADHRTPASSKLVSPGTIVRQACPERSGASRLRSEGSVRRPSAEAAPSRRPVAISLARRRTPFTC